MTTIFEGIGNLFTNFLFVPLHAFRSLELTNWWTANFINWIFMIICATALVYWCKQIALHQKNGENEQDTTAHSFLK